jgi:hypothetical protein
MTLPNKKEAPHETVFFQAYAGSLPEPAHDAFIPDGGSDLYGIRRPQKGAFDPERYG